MPLRRIAFLPHDEVKLSNAYPVRMREILEKFGTVESFEGVKATVGRVLRLRGRRYDAIVVNWVENEMIDPATRAISMKAIVKIVAKALLMRLASRRTIFVRHNNYPHATRAGEEKAAERWVDRFERLHRFVITHSGAEAAHRHYVPHPLYAPAAIAAPSDPTYPRDYYVAFGSMFPYKHLAELIEAFPDSANLVVIGAVGDPDYTQRLVAMQRSNVIVRPGFLSEADAQGIVSRSRALLLVHADPNVVVSGSFFYAMSLNTPVIAVETPFLRWVAARVGPALLTIASDTNDVCERVRVRSDRLAGHDDSSAIQREFGDAAIVAALAGILWEPATSRPTM